MGLLILLRQPRNRVGWLLQGIGLVWGLTGLLDTYAEYGLVINPGSLPRPDVAAALGEGAWVPGIGLMGTFLILLFPDGHLPSPRWRPVAWLSGVTIAATTVLIEISPGVLEESPIPTMSNPLALESAETLIVILLAIFFPLLPLCMVASAVALVRRFRRSRGSERQQMKWLATAAVIVTMCYLVTMVATFLAALMDNELAWVLLLQKFAIASFVLLPLAIGVAVLRYRLYDIDVVINRTLVYGSLTATLAGTYLASVLLLQLVLSPLTDSR